MLLVATTQQRDEADTLAAELRTQLSERGVPVQVVEVTEDDAPAFKVGVGNYPSQKAAEAVRGLLSDVLPEEAEPYPMPAEQP